MSPAGLALRWRHLLLAGLAAGLLASPLLDAPPAAGWSLAACAPLLIACRPRDRPEGRTVLAALAFVALLLSFAALGGLLAGDARLRAIDGGALRAAVGSQLSVRGFVTAPPRRSDGEVRVPIATAAGRLMIVAPDGGDELPVGAELRARGVAAEPEPWRADELERLGIALELRSERPRLTGRLRGGLLGRLDAARERAAAALERGVGEPEAALLRGFVLGEDDRIEPDVRDEFRRSGLAHLLAVSGQNVVLLAILASVLLAGLGVGLRPRLVVILLLVAAYVPIAGGGPSIQRAGVMGAAAIVATLSSRPADRAYVALLAAAATLLLNPRAGGDVGWQLSFAAVIGIMLWARPLAVRLGGHSPAGTARPALADGAAVTLAATAATAPLMVHHFGAASVASVPANLLALPAVAPVMWLGMLAGMLGQIPPLPTAPIGLLSGPLVAYVASIAEWLGTPEWALLELRLDGPLAVACAYGALLAGGVAAARFLRRRAGTILATAGGRIAAAALLAAALGLAATMLGGAPVAAPPPPGSLRIVALDVGQGDAILLRTPSGRDVLVDGGPSGGPVLEQLDRAGVERLAAVVATHDQADHVGGLHDVLAALPVDRLIRGRPAPSIEASARAGGARLVAVAEGSAVRIGALRLEVLWPPREGLAAATAEEDPNLGSLVVLARWHRYSALLSGDAEAEATGLDPGPLDVLKVAHHGSDDAGLVALLDRSVPRVALISVGSGNGYGHPTAATLEQLEEHGTCTLRTDLDGAAAVELGPAGIAVSAADGSLEGRAGCVGPSASG